MGFGPNDGGASRYHIMDQVKASLKRLNTDHIDVYQLHGLDRATPVEEMVRALDDLVRQGHVRYVGVSNWAAWQIVDALGVAERLNAARFQSVQSYYSLVGRDLEREIVPMIEAKKLGLMVWGPLAGGFLSGKYLNGIEGRRKTVAFPPVDEARGEDILPVLDTIAKAHSVTMATIAMAWLLHQKAVTSVLIGAKRLEQLDENLRATTVALSLDDLNSLEEVSALKPEYPGWMVHVHGVPRRQLWESGRLPVQQ